MEFAKKLIALPVALLAAGCGLDSHAHPTELSIADIQACGAFTTVNWLVHESMDPTPTPAGLSSRTYDLVGLANALNNAYTQDVSEPLAAALNSYIYSLTNLGAILNHSESRDAAADAYTVVNTALRTVIVLCAESGYQLADSGGSAPGRDAADPYDNAVAPTHGELRRPIGAARGDRRLEPSGESGLVTSV
ncbi:hypothetical protein [Mycobacteroides abscessus]|uniref:hypothetical protein n=1 Tax=Mycobacteroides abscessus TaxID=36809 RepID=UPI0009A5B923|nr:hypothetical protein [Mycobacteroides abscessus]SKT85738.1 Uncharacterised protein [Mycobacteroides abscessus subsp. massiliense]SKU05086.1 Uncharacterised protein [Mycobacteroides abscessus subsp. massiliense]